MQTTILPKVTAGATVALAVAVLAAAHTPVAASMKAASMGGQISKGKALVSVYRCNGCHAADLAGKPGFSPSLHRSGVLKEYSLKTFARVLMTGVTANGGHVHPPMPVYGMAMRPMGGPPPGGMGGPPPGGPPPGGMGGPPPGGPPPGMGGMHHGGMHGPPPPPMKPVQAVAIYTYLHTLPYDEAGAAVPFSDRRPRPALETEEGAIEKDRLNAFSDGVIAIIITIMVLGLKAPQSATWESLRPVLPVFLSYILSYVNVGIYWNNHHHMLAVTTRVRGAVLWANLHLLFWLSLIPFCTDWLGSAHFAAVPTALYGAILLGTALAYLILQRTLLQTPDQNPALATAIGRDAKGKSCPPLYALAIGLAFYRPWIADAIYGGVALLWLIPDPRIERVAADPRDADGK